MQRRAFIEGVLAGGTVMAVGAIAGAAEAGAPGAEPACSPRVAADVPERAPELLCSSEVASAEHVWPLLAPLGAGDQIGLGWSILALTGVTYGGAVLTLVNRRGTSARVHLCRRSAGSRPIAHSDSIDLFLMNHGDGSVPTDETLGRVLNVLCRLIRHNEETGAGATDSMLSHEARLRFYRAERALV